MTNQTTYEIYHKEKNPHLRIFKDLKKSKLESLNIKIKDSTPFHPFDLGIIENFKCVYYNSKER